MRRFPCNLPRVNSNIIHMLSAIREGYHTFHIPVMGLGFTIDTPLKTGRFGISSVVSVMEDHLLESMRQFHSEKNGLTYTAIKSGEADYRARRITAYLDCLQDVLDKQMQVLRGQDFEHGSDLAKYFELLPDDSALKASYRALFTCGNAEDRRMAEDFLRDMLRPGDIDVNIMTKLDKQNQAPDGSELGPEYTDAVSALRGFAKSKLRSSVVFSAGMNPRLFASCEQFSDFFPDKSGRLVKRVILKVSDFRSARIQGIFLAKKGIWVSEFRIESGLNCGGHAFATDGYLMGPILEEFRNNKAALQRELFDLCQQALAEKGKFVFPGMPGLRLTAQGGVGTGEEHRFLLAYYGLDAIGWGSPFLLVPEATNLDEDTLRKLANAKPSDYFLSNASPLGVPFNNFRPSSSEAQRKERISKGRPGSPCYKKFLAMDTEFTDLPICTASRQYQKLKIEQIRQTYTDPEILRIKIAEVEDKDCLCEGLGVPALLRNGLPLHHKLNAVVVCPGPNLAYFSGTFSLAEMAGHIYGRNSLLNRVPRPHMFVNELLLYVVYLGKKLDAAGQISGARASKGFVQFRDNLNRGIHYYTSLLREGILQSDGFAEQLRMAGEQLLQLERKHEHVFNLV